MYIETATHLERTVDAVSVDKPSYSPDRPFVLSICFKIRSAPFRSTPCDICE